MRRVLATSLKTRIMKNGKLHITVLYLVLTVIFCVSLIVANLVEIKTVDLGFMTITAGVVVFPISYIINDCVVEVYGFRAARLMIWVGFGAQLVVTLMLRLALWLPGSAEWTGQEAMALTYGAMPRVMAASFLAFVCGSMVNAYVMSRMKSRDASDRHFSLRAIVSTVCGEGLDSAIFFPVAFLGIFSLSTIIALIFSQVVIKTLYEILILPVTVRVVRRLKSVEHLDVSVHSDVSAEPIQFKQ